MLTALEIAFKPTGIDRYVSKANFGDIARDHLEPPTRATSSHHHPSACHHEVPDLITDLHHGQVMLPLLMAYRAIY
jgi:hypothetical protein